jgi:hypothetical protein
MCRLEATVLLRRSEEQLFSYKIMNKSFFVLAAITITRKPWKRISNSCGDSHARIISPKKLSSNICIQIYIYIYIYIFIYIGPTVRPVNGGSWWQLPSPKHSREPLKAWIHSSEIIEFTKMKSAFACAQHGQQNNGDSRSYVSGTGCCCRQFQGRRR